MRHNGKKKLLIISLDACGDKDLDIICSGNEFKDYLNDAAVVKGVKSVYPSLTYPAHTAVVTGKNPIHSGITNNLRIQILRYWKPDWTWYRSYVNGTTLYDEAKSHGYKTASLLWPVTAWAHINYNMPEIFANRSWHCQVDRSLIFGSSLYQLNMLRLYGKGIRGIEQPNLDDFIYKSMIRTLTKYDVDMMMVHFADVDTVRHRYGVNGRKAKDALYRHKERLNGLVRTLKDTGFYDETSIVVLGDHYQKDTHTILYPNYMLRKAGLIKTDGMLRILSYKAFSLNCDGAAYIYLKDRRQRDHVRDLLYRWKDSNKGIKAILERPQIKAKGADGRCDFMLEANDGYYFLDLMEQEEERVSDAGKRGQRATHGYDPEDRDYRTFFMMKDEGVKPGDYDLDMSLPDEGVTIARLFGWDLGNADGRVVNEILRD